jgi:hypothetical protein
MVKRSRSLASAEFSRVEDPRVKEALLGAAYIMWTMPRRGSCRKVRNREDRTEI